MDSVPLQGPLAFTPTPLPSSMPPSSEAFQATTSQRVPMTPVPTTMQRMVPPIEGQIAASHFPVPSTSRHTLAVPSSSSSIIAQASIQLFIV